MHKTLQKQIRLSRSKQTLKSLPNKSTNASYEKESAPIPTEFEAYLINKISSLNKKQLSCVPGDFLQAAAEQQNAFKKIQTDRNKRLRLDQLQSHHLLKLNSENQNILLNQLHLQPLNESFQRHFYTKVHDLKTGSLESLRSGAIRDSFHNSKQDLSFIQTRQLSDGQLGDSISTSNKFFQNNEVRAPAQFILVTQKKHLPQQARILNNNVISRKSLNAKQNGRSQIFYKQVGAVIANKIYETSASASVNSTVQDISSLRPSPLINRNFQSRNILNDQKYCRIQTLATLKAQMLSRREAMAQKVNLRQKRQLNDKNKLLNWIGNRSRAEINNILSNSLLNKGQIL